MSNLIKSKNYFQFDIESFEDEDFADALDIPVPGAVHDTLVLPLGENGITRVAMNHYDPGQKLARVERDAYEKGFEQGQKDGLALGGKKAQETWKKMIALFEELSLFKEKILQETENDVIKLSMRVARKIVKKEVSLDPDTVRRSVHDALKFLKDKSFVRILINPGDMKNLEGYLSELAVRNKIQKLEVAEDNCVEPGGCILETGFGRVNATIEDQLDELERALEEAFQTEHKSGQVGE